VRLAQLVKTGLYLGNVSDATWGWAYTIIGMTGVKLWDERDNLQMQLNYGEGYSRYVNDQGSINKSDAAFNPLTGQLDPVPFFAMYIAFQKWWPPAMRSNFNYGYVSVDNKLSNIVLSAYKSTNRFTANCIWSPIARIDLGPELLVGSQTNENVEKGKAMQV
jgi:hypothetical protein